MDLALIAIIVSIIVLILQIISLSKIASLEKKITANAAAKPQVSGSHSSQDRSGDRRDQNYNRQRRPGQDFRNKPTTQNTQPTTSATPTDSTEKSLRDINLKLKNAERDQDFARKKIHDNFGSKDQGNRRRDDQRRGGNSRGDYRRDNRGGNNWHDQKRSSNGNSSQGNNTRPMQNNSTVSAVSTDETPNFDANLENKLAQAPIQADVIAATENTPVSSGPEIVASDFAANDLQHGRKLHSKRSFVKEGEENVGLVSTENTNDSESKSNESSSEVEFAEKSSEIQFGRR